MWQTPANLPWQTLAANAALMRQTRGKRHGKRQANTGGQTLANAGKRWLANARQTLLYNMAP
eukprot:12915427-Prorocentrum_lima.AAC.1